MSDLLSKLCFNCGDYFPFLAPDHRCINCTMCGVDYVENLRKQRSVKSFGGSPAPSGNPIPRAAARLPICVKSLSAQSHIKTSTKKPKVKHHA